MDVKWIKITTDMFDNRKIRHLRRLPDGNSIVLIWVMLLTLAGRCNAGGMVFLTENIPYTPKMLADELDFEESTITLAINALEQLGMVSSDPLKVTNWEEYQNVESMERIREQTRKRMADYRARKRLGVTSVGENCVYCGKPANTVDHIIPKSKGGEDAAWNLVPCCKSCNSSKADKDLAVFLNDSFFYAYQNLNHDLIQSNEKLMALVKFDNKSNRYVTVASRYDKEKDKDIEEEIDIENRYINTSDAIRKTEQGSEETADAAAVSSDLISSADKIREAWNAAGLPSVRRFLVKSDRGQAIATLVEGYGLDTVLECVERAGKSEFLKRPGTRISFDWFLKPDNFQKVLEGNYDERWVSNDDLGGTDGTGGAEAARGGRGAGAGDVLSISERIERKREAAKRKWGGLGNTLD